MNRRQLLATVGVGIGGMSGCLRLTRGGSETTSAGEAATTTERQPTETSTGGLGSEAADRVTLTENWVGDPGLDLVWTEGGSIYFNGNNGAGRASHGSGVKWEQDATYEGFESNFGADAFADRVWCLATELAAGPPIAQAYTKRAIHAGRDDEAAGLEVESQAFGHLLGTEDFAEGVAAFVDDEHPEFSGE